VRSCRTPCGTRGGDDGHGECDLERDSPQQEPVGGDTGFAQRYAFGPGRERRADLARDDAEKGHRRGLQVGVM
jgi:hypothetical protein